MIMECGPAAGHRASDECDLSANGAAGLYYCWCSELGFAWGVNGRVIFEHVHFTTVEAEPVEAEPVEAEPGFDSSRLKERQDSPAVRKVDAQVRGMTAPSTKQWKQGTTGSSIDYKEAQHYLELMVSSFRKMIVERRMGTTTERWTEGPAFLIWTTWKVRVSTCLAPRTMAWTSPVQPQVLDEVETHQAHACKLHRLLTHCPDSKVALMVLPVHHMLHGQ
jgi:hypothetical protein